MSGVPPKRLHDDSGHATPMKRPLEDSSLFSSLSGKITQPAGNDFHLPYDSSHEGRSLKMQRIEHRDFDKRMSLHRTPNSSNNPSLDHSVASENRLEFRNSKESRDAKNEYRDVKPESRELNSDLRADGLVSKGENEVRQEIKDEKEVRSDRGPHGPFRGDMKFDKDSYTTSTSHHSWKEAKEYHRGKRYIEAANDGLDSWRVARHSILQTDEFMKDVPAVEERDSIEAHETVGENKVDLKEEKLREKDRKRKDERHRDFGEREKDKMDRKNSLLQVNPVNERKDKDLHREERELERWERERKDTYRDKERNEKEKDLTKVEPNAIEKENLHSDKERLDGSGKLSEMENSILESSGLKDESLKAYERDSKERKAERDIDPGERAEHRGRCNDKEEDVGSPEGDGITEKDREVFGSSVQHRRRMSRTRGTPQSAHREPRFRSKARDIEGSQGKADASSVVYKAGECMQELLRSWKEFEASQHSKNDQCSQNYPTLEIRIPAEYVTATNHQVRGGQLWGTDIYTDDSDLVAVLMHTGYCRPTSTPPPPAIQELRATIRILPPQDCYTSRLRNNVRSRAWGAGIGCSYRVERCCIMKKGGGTIDLEPHLNHMSTVEPTLAPVSVERTMTTRSAASNALRQKGFVREVTIQYNLCNEPWLKYSISVVADKGLKKPLYTSARLKKGEVLYLETHFNRYELSFNGEKAMCNGTVSTSSQVPETDQEKLQSHSSHTGTSDKNQTDRENIIDVFRWARCKMALPQNVMRSIGIPLPLEHVEVMEENLAWEDVQWSQTGVWVSGKEYALARVHFLAPN